MVELAFDLVQQIPESFRAWFVAAMFDAVWIYAPWGNENMPNLTAF
jgi:hypothetical protein